MRSRWTLVVGISLRWCASAAPSLPLVMQDARLTSERVQRMLLAPARPRDSGGRVRLTFDAGWLFNLGDPPGFDMCSINGSFPLPLNNTQCWGLSPVGDVPSEQACMDACCAQPSCQMYNYCPPGATLCTPGTCWVGPFGDTCVNGTQWLSRGRAAALPPPPQTTGPETPAFDDSGWRALSVPHDSVVEGSYVNDSVLEGHGYLQPNISFYRKHFTVNASWEGSTIWLDFDGIYRSSDVWLNGVWLGHHDSGFTSFRYYLHNATNATGAPALLYGGADNVLAVRVDPTFFEGWWYLGGGIHRHVWLNAADPLFIVPWATYAMPAITGVISSPDGGNGPQTATAAVINFITDVYNGRTESSVNVTITVAVLDTEGATVASTVIPAMLNASSWGRFTATFPFDNGTTVQLWNMAAPYLYTLETSLVVAGTVVDAEALRIGVRRAIILPSTGFMLNDVPIKLRGVCNHQDFAGCGIAVPDRMNAYRVARMQEMGMNAWRMSHNPPNPELLDMMDAAGMVALVENRNFLNGSQYVQDARDMALRDRNHASVIAFSLCNEYGCYLGGPDGAMSAAIGAMFKEAIQEVDFGYHQITAAIRDDGSDAWAPTWHNGVANMLDVLGINYNAPVAPQYALMRPYKPMLGTESASCQTDRDVLAFNASAGYVGILFNPWCTPDNGQNNVISPAYAGAMIWTGMDYRGEPNPLSFPSIGAHYGTMDAAGFDKTSSMYYRIWWGGNSSYVYVFPHWNRHGAEGTSVPVLAYATAPYVELFLNGVSAGRQAMPPLGYVQWSVVYQPGNVTVVGYDAPSGGNEISSGVAVTAGLPTQLMLTVDAGADGIIAAGGVDVFTAAVAVLDDAGRMVPTANNNITFTLTGPGAVYGVGNGDPACLEADKGVAWRSAFNGLARVLVRATGAVGAITLTATSPGLAPATVVVNAV